MSDGVLRYRLSEVEEFVSERERLSSLRLYVGNGAKSAATSIK
jgi:hypothetical protein